MGMQPKLRFKGFTDDWEKRKLGDIGSVAMNKRIFKSETFDYGDVPFYKIGTFGKIADSFITREKFTEYKAKYPFPKNGDVLISASGSIGKTVVYHGEDAYFQDSNIVWLEHDGQIDNKFLEQFYKIVRWSGVEGSTIKRLYNKNILNTSISIPNLDEQEKIGELLYLFDFLITVNQRKVDLLKKKKTGYLQKLFPKNGQNNPELRFKGFTDAWEKRKLLELATFSKGQGYSKKDLVSSGYPIILYGRLYTNYQVSITTVNDTFVASNKNAVISEIGDVIVPGSGETAEEISRASSINIAGIILGGDLNVIHPYQDRLDSTFLALNISNGVQQKELTKRAQGKSIVHIHNSDLQTITLKKPELYEQQKISKLFIYLDNLITVNQRKVDLLKKEKKALLQKMFI